MFFRSSLLFTALAATSSALAGPIEARAAKSVEVSCVPAGVEASCYSLVSSCLLGVTSSTKSSLWHNGSCVAAATCYGVGNLETSLACQLNTAVVTNQEQISLDYNIYAAIVGSCAYAPNGCPITQQNFIDFYYGSLTTINSGSFPTSPNVVISWWSSIASWAATGNTIPYTNFNDWLHYSTYPAPITVTPPTTTTSTIAPTTSSTISTSTTAPTTSSTISTSTTASTTSSTISTSTTASTTSSTISTSTTVPTTSSTISTSTIAPTTSSTISTSTIVPTPSPSSTVVLTRTVTATSTATV